MNNTFFYNPALRADQQLDNLPLELDLVDEMQWEDSDKVEWLTLEEAGLEQVERDVVCSAQLAYYMEEGDH